LIIDSEISVLLRKPGEIENNSSGWFGQIKGAVCVDFGSRKHHNLKFKFGLNASAIIHCNYYARIFQEYNIVSRRDINPNHVTLFAGLPVADTLHVCCPGQRAWAYRCPAPGLWPHMGLQGSKAFSYQY
jgi:hypothetical protein